MPPELDLLSDGDAALLIEINVDRVADAIVRLRLPAVGAFALWLPNEPQLMEPSALSVCSAEAWTRRFASFEALPDPRGLAVALDSQSWDLPEVDLDGELDFETFDAVSNRVYERFGEERDPAAQVLDETARRVARVSSIVHGPTLVAMVTDGSSMLESIRYASPKASVAALEAAGLPQPYQDLL